MLQQAVLMTKFSGNLNSLWEMFKKINRNSIFDRQCHVSMLLIYWVDQKHIMSLMLIVPTWYHCTMYTIHFANRFVDKNHFICQKSNGLWGKQKKRNCGSQGKSVSHTETIRMFFIKSNWTHSIIIIQWIELPTAVFLTNISTLFICFLLSLFILRVI